MKDDNYFEDIVASLQADNNFETRNFEKFELLELSAVMNDLSAFFTRIVAHSFMLGEEILALNEPTKQLLADAREVMAELQEHFLGECDCEFCECDCDPVDPCDDCLERLEEYAEEEEENE